MDTKRIISILKKGKQEYTKIKLFSKHPGIYAVFFTGNNFPILGVQVLKNEIIYIGKTLSGQEARDAKTHFTSGKTGNSTLRKSIGSLLKEKAMLSPVPRNETDYKRGRFSHFKFDDRSERIITDWMMDNLGLSFYQFNGSKKELENLETKLIQELVPILNISKNGKNPFRNTLKGLRSNCAKIAEGSI